MDAADNEDEELRLFNSVCKRSRCSLLVCEIKLQFLKLLLAVAHCLSADSMFVCVRALAPAALSGGRNTCAVDL